MQRVERRGERHDGRFVVGSRAGVDAPFRVETRAFGGKRDNLAVLIERTVAQHRLPGRRGPFLGIERLAVIVRVEDNGAGGARRGDFAINGGRRAGNLQ